MQEGCCQGQSNASEEGRQEGQPRSQTIQNTKNEGPIRKFGSLIFPNAFKVGKDKLSLLAWFAIFCYGIYSIQSAFDPKPYAFGPEIRAFIGCFSCYAALNVLFNKAVVYELI